MRLVHCLAFVLLTVIPGLLLLLHLHSAQLSLTQPAAQHTQSTTTRGTGRLRTPLSRRRLYLGLDLSTQGLKATLLDADTLRVAHTTSVNFDVDLPRFRTEGGAHKHGSRVTSPTLMWVEAMDLLFRRLNSTDVPGLALHADSSTYISGVSASGQQHGSVYWANGAEPVLSHQLDPARTLAAQLTRAFAVGESPIWMDSSTRAECARREQAVGGALQLAKISGSRAFERFTGNQIAAVARSRRGGGGGEGGLGGVERISLVSSFVASLLAGKYVGIDSSDAGGMNLMDIRTKAWDRRLLAVSVPDGMGSAMADGVGAGGVGSDDVGEDGRAASLASLLGPIIHPHSVVGPLSPYFRRRYGSLFSRHVSEACVVVASSGDNPCSLAGLGLSKEGDVGISLGSSDTMFGVLSQPNPGTLGHVFINPVNPRSYFAMLVFQNGGLVREQIRDEFSRGDWGVFSAAFARTPKGNRGRVGMYLVDPEITPSVNHTGFFRYHHRGNDGKRELSTAAFGDHDAEVRAAVEGRMLAMRLHSTRIGLARPKMLLATGGGSKNVQILQVHSTSTQPTLRIYKSKYFRYILLVHSRRFVYINSDIQCSKTFNSSCSKNIRTET
jgi:xylulokinase